MQRCDITNSTSNDNSAYHTLETELEHPVWRHAGADKIDSLNDILHNRVQLVLFDRLYFFFMPKVCLIAQIYFLYTRDVVYFKPLTLRCM